jgi:hypothetical protein
MLDAEIHHLVPEGLDLGDHAAPAHPRRSRRESSSDPRPNRIPDRRTHRGQGSPQARALWQRVDRELTDAAPWVPLMVTKDVNFLSKRVGNYQDSPQMGMLIDQLWVR